MDGRTGGDPDGTRMLTATLRHFLAKDAPLVYQQLQADPGIAYWCGFSQPRNVQHARNLIRWEWSNDEDYAICLPWLVSPIGLVSLQEHATEWELGYWLAADHRHKGIARSACEQVLRHAFNELHLHRVRCGWFHGNTQSLRLQERLGFRYHHDEACATPQGIRKLHVSYLTKEEYDSNHQKRP